MNNHLLQGVASFLVPFGLYAMPQQAYGSNQKGSLYSSIKINTQASGKNKTNVRTKVDDVNELELITSETINELVIIDQAVADKYLIYQQLKPGMEVREISSNSHGLTQLTHILSQYNNLDSLHVFSHAEDGSLLLGNSRITSQELNSEVDTFSAIDGALKDGADLLLYGCNLAQSSQGEQFLELISHKANVDIAASNDLTGNAALGGDWDLEITRGDIDTSPLTDSIAMADFSSVLVDKTVNMSGFNLIGYVETNTYSYGAYTFRLTSSETLTGSMACRNYGDAYCYEDWGDNGDGDKKVYFDLTGGERFNLTSIYLYTSLAQDFTFESDKGDSATLSLGNTSGLPKVLNWTGITRLTIRRTDNANMSRIKFDNFVLTNIQSPNPTITSVTYDSSTGNMVVTGTNFEAKSGGANDITVNKLTITGEGGGGSAYTLTSGTNIERDSATQFTVPVSGVDKLRVDALFNKNSTSADDGTTYNLAAADDFIANITADNTAIATNGVTVSNYANPVITSSTYDANAGSLVVTGTGFSSTSDANNDVVANTFTFTGDGGDTYTLTDTSNVEVASSTSFTFTLSATDKQHINGLLNKNGTNAASGQAYNLAAADNWMAGGAANANTADSAATITTSNVTAPNITSSSYNAGTGILTVTGTNFVNQVGATNDIDVSKLNLTGEAGNSYTLTSSNVEITSATTFSVTLNATDKLVINGLLNKDGTQADDGATNYNLNAAEDYMNAVDPATSIVDATNTVTVSNVQVPTLTSATYNAGTKSLVVTGTGFARKFGANDIDTSKLSLTGQGGNSYTLTTGGVEVSSETEFSVTINDTDKINANGLLNKDGTQAGDNTTYNLSGAEDWQVGAATNATVADTVGNGVTVSGTSNPTVTSATYDAAMGILAVTGTGMVKKSGVTNDVDVTKLIVKGQASGTRTLTTTNVEITNETSFSITLNAGDKTAVDALLNLNGTQSGDSVTYNLNAAEDWMAGADVSANIVDATLNGITVSNVPVPTITSATYNASIGDLVVTGTDFEAKSGGANDVTANLFTLTGQSGGTYTLTDTANVEITNATTFTLTLSATDKINIAGLLNKDGTQADNGSTYNLAAADDFMANATAGNTADATNAITVSSYSNPVISSATYDFITGNLVVTGTGFSQVAGANNDVDPTKLTLTGDAGGSYLLTSSGVEVTNGTTFTVTLNATDKNNINGLLNKNGTASDTGTTYNLAAADNWMAGGPPTADITDATSNGITVSNVASPVITSATYDATTGVVVVTGTHFVNEVGASNDVDVSLFTFTGDNSATYSIISTSDVEITSATQFSFTLSGADKTNVDGLLNKNGTNSDISNTTYNLAASDNWMAGAAATANITDATGNGIIVSNVTVPTITSSTYDFTTGVLVVTGTNFRNLSGGSNDVDLTKLALKGEGNNAYTLTGSSVDISSATQFSITLSETDKINVNGLLNKNGTSAEDAVTYNLAAADNWMGAALTATDITDVTSAVTVSNVNIPTITSITYDHATGLVTVTGLNFVKQFGVSNDIDISLLTFTGEGGGTYTITSAVDIEITSSTSFSFTLSGADLTNVNALMTANGGNAGSGTTYNIAAADNWMAGSAASTNIADTTGNTITVSNVPAPVITSATYDATTGILTVTGSDFTAKSGALNDISVSKLTLKGESADTYTLTSGDVEITNSTSFSVTLNSADKLNINGLLNKDGTQADDNTVYNLAAADNFVAEITSGDTSDLTANGITVSSVVAPTVTSATYDATTGVMVVTGTDLVHKSGVTNDIDVSTLTVTGENAGSYTLTSTTDVEITNATSFTLTLSGVDKTNIDGLLNKNGLSSDDSGTSYNLAVADNWLAGSAASTNISDVTSNAITVSNVLSPTISSATYDATTGVLAVSGANFTSKSGVTNDVDISLLTLKGEGDVTYTLTSATDVDITSSSVFSVTLSGIDKTHVDGLLNKNGTNSDNSNTLYNLSAADDWMQAVALSSDISDATNAITTSNVTVPTITSATYDGNTGTLVVTGTNLRKLDGATNDVDVTKLTLTGQGAGTYLLTSSNVEITSATEFSVTLNSTDQTQLAILLNKNGTSAVDASVYNIAGADNWMPGAAASTDISDVSSNSVTVSNAVKPTVVLTTSSANIAEAAGVSTVTATLSSATAVNVIVNLTYSGTAVNAGDYTKSADSITILSGQLTGTATITAVQDNLVEATETVIVDITSITNNDATENGVQQQTVSIIDDDVATVSLSVNNVNIAEAAGISTITATLDKATFENVTVNLGYSGTATTLTDYTVSASSITILAGQTTGTAAITAVQDTSSESGETILIDITGVSGGSASESGTQQQTVTITDDETVAVTLSASSNNIAEAGGSSTVTATLSQAAFETVTVNLGYSGTATSGSDYVTPPTSIVIAAGQTTGTATLTAIQDTNVEGGETIIVDITGVSGGAASESGTQQQTVTITDDETVTVSLSATPVTILEASGSSTVTATLSQATFEAVTVTLGYSGTATSGSDYVTPSTSIVIAAGQTTGTATLTAIQDTNSESGETIIVDITGVSGGAASESGTQQQTVTITDDEVISVSLSATPINISEAVQSSSVTATLSQVAFETVVVNLGYSGTANNGTDYDVAGTSISISAGQLSGSTSVTSRQDSIEESNETIIVDIVSVTGANSVESGTQQLTLTILNDDNETNDDTATVDEDNSVQIDVLDNDVGLGGTLNPASVTITNAASNGSTSINTANGFVTYTPTENFNGTDTFTYQVSDLLGNTSSDTNVTITINSINDAPVAANDTATVDEDGAVTIDVLNNDTDVDGTNEINVNSLSIVTQATNGVAVISEGQIIYTPNENYNGSDVFNYTVSDVSGAVSASASVSVNVSGSNDAPNTQADVATGNEDTLMVIDVLSNDEDIDGELEVTSVEIVTEPQHGITVVQPDGSIHFTPEDNFFGDDSFTYTVKDNNNAVSAATSVSVTVQSVNDVPVSQNDTVVILEDVAHLINILGNDSDVDGNIVTIAITTTPDHGTVTVDNINLNVLYTPDSQFSGSDSFSYQTTDNDGGVSNSAEVLLTVEMVNDAPEVNPDSVQTNEDEFIEINVLLNDNDIDGQLDETSVVITAQPVNGTVQVMANGNIIYTPVLNFNGADQFTYQVTDDQGESGSASVDVQVNAVNDIPEAQEQSLTTAEDTAVNIELLGTDIDGDILTYIIVNEPQFGTLTGSGSSYVYQPNDNFTGSDNFTYMVNDGQSDSSIATVAINVGSNNDAPTANDLSIDTNEDTAIGVTLTGEDLDGDSLSYTVLTQPVNGLLSGQVPDLIYTPNINFNGSDTFTFKVNDGQLDSNIATVQINVSAENDQPSADNQQLSLDEDSVISVNLTGSDPDGDLLNFTILTNPVNGVISDGSSNLIYTPNANFNGTDSLTFIANDGTADSVSAQVEFTVHPVNDQPLAIDDNISRDNWETFNIDVLSNDSDLDGDVLTIFAAKVATGTVTRSNNMLTYTPVTGFNGTAVIEYSITDNQGGIDSALVLVDIAVVNNQVPVISVPADIEVNAVALNTKVNLGVATAIDQFGVPVPVSLVNGTNFFKPGINTVFWQATDSDDLSAIASQLVKVNPLISLDKDQTVLEGYSVTVGVRLNGLSPVYPLEVPYTVSGTAEQGVDHDLMDGTLVIQSGTQGFIQFNVLSDDIFEGEETLIIELDSELNLGSKSIHTMTITEGNVSPKLSLNAHQAQESRFIVNMEDGVVVVKSKVVHPDPSKQFSYDWINTEQVLIDIDDDETQFSFEPEGLSLGIYHITLVVKDLSDMSFGTSKQITLKLEQSKVTLGETDTDGDGIPDNMEGSGDGDNDGIPNYQDAITECNVVPETLGSSNDFLVEGDPGVCLRLGDIALGGESGGTRIVNGELLDEDSINIGGVFDFIAYDLPLAGQAYRIVLPQVQPIPANAIYRKQLASGLWVDFVENTTDQLWSTAGEMGYCPPPGDAIWSAGLTEGHWCVQLVITDGGPNDSDGEANHTIVDPGGVAVIKGSNSQPEAMDDVIQTRINTAITINVLVNDIDADGNELTINSANAVFGSVTINDNQLIYQPAADFFGIEKIVYGISDGQGGSSSASVIVTILPNEAPTTVNDVAAVTAGESITIDVLENDSDPESDALSVISATADNGMVIINQDNTISYTSNAGFSGIDTIEYEVQDALGAVATGQVTVTVSSTSTKVKIKTSGGAMLFMLFNLMALLLYRRNILGIKR